MVSRIVKLVAEEGWKRRDIRDQKKIDTESNEQRKRSEKEIHSGIWFAIKDMSDL